MCGGGGGLGNEFSGVYGGVVIVVELVCDGFDCVGYNF